MSAPLQPLPIRVLPPVGSAPPPPMLVSIASTPLANNRGWRANYRRPEPINGSEEGKVRRAAQILMNIKRSNPRNMKKTRRSSRKTKKNTRRR